MPDPIAHTRAWVQKMVIGLNLCPFAALPFRQDRIRYVLTETSKPQTLAGGLWKEARRLDDADPTQVETTLLIHPQCLTDFGDYLDFIPVAEGILEELDLVGTMQLATFHPDYQFAGTTPTSVENYTNRSPYPMLHLLREDSVEDARRTYPDIEAIPDRNIARLRGMGEAAIRARLVCILSDQRP